MINSDYARCACRYVYQKAYVEFFCSTPQLEALLAAAAAHPSLTYLATNRGGELRTNLKPDAVNAVTWGVFPGKEVVQPTVVDPHSFLVWKVMCPHGILRDF